MPVDFKKLTSDQHVTVAIAPSGGALGITDIAVPTADELNNVGGASGVINASPSISWNDWGFGFSASETSGEPSLADVSTYEEFTTTNFGGEVSYFVPNAYDDNSNTHSIVYDLTDEPGVLNDFVVRIDGAKRTSTPFANGDFVHAFRVQAGSESNPFTPGESTRRTVGYNAYGDFAHYTIVGPHTLSVIGTPTFTVGSKGRLRISVQGRDYTNALSFRSSDAAVIQIFPGGFYEVIGSGTATIEVEDVEAGTSLTVPVTTAA